MEMMNDRKQVPKADGTISDIFNCSRISTALEDTFPKKEHALNGPLTEQTANEFKQQHQSSDLSENVLMPSTDTPQSYKMDQGVRL